MHPEVNQATNGVFLPCHPGSVWGKDVFYTRSIFFLILLSLHRQLHQCNPRDVLEERGRSRCHRRGGQDHVPVGVQVPTALFEGRVTRPHHHASPLAAWPCPAAWSAGSWWYAVGPNGLALGQRGDGSAPEQFLRKLLSGWHGLHTRPQDEVRVHTHGPLPGTPGCWR